MKIGLVGFPGSGKTTVFNALTGLSAGTGFSAARGKTNLGTVKVPDERVVALANLFHPKKSTLAEITFSDVAGSGAAKSLDDQTLAAMREVDALCQVVRGFPDAAGAPPAPLAEARNLEDEMNLADLLIIEKRLDRLKREKSKSAEVPLMERLKEALEAGTPLRGVNLTPDEWATLAGFRFLTAKPLLLVLNVAEGEVAAPAPDALARAAAERGLGLVVLSARVEMDIAQLDASEQGEFLASIGLTEPAVHRFIRAAFELIDLISMLTSGPDECRAWPVPRGTLAPRAAGKIHSDIERGFIRAEVIRCEDLLKYGSESKCKDAGALRIEGKEYVVQDGDVVHFRFNV